MQNAVVIGLLASVACGIMGTYVVVRRIVFISGGISHTVLGGMGIAYYYGHNPIHGAVVAAIAAALIIGFVSVYYHQHEDTLIGALWAVGMAVGLLFIYKTPGYNVDLMSYLFGSILTVPASDLWLMLVLVLVILAVTVYFYQDFLAMSYDEEFARVRGVAVAPLYFLLIAMLAVTVVLIIQVVGLILVIALLTIPTFIAEKYANSLAKMMIYASLLNVGFTLCGLWLAYRFNLTSGAAIILVAGAGFFLAVLLDHLGFRRRPAINPRSI